MTKPFWTEYESGYHEAYLDDARRLRLLVSSEEDDRRSVSLECEGNELWGADFDAKYPVEWFRRVAAEGAARWLGQAAENARTLRADFDVANAQDQRESAMAKAGPSGVDGDGRECEP